MGWLGVWENRGYGSVIYIKVKLSCYKPGVAQRVGRGIALLFHDCGTRRWLSGQQHAPAAFYPRDRPGTHFTRGRDIYIYIYNYVHVQS